MVLNRRTEWECCPPKPGIEERLLISFDQAQKLEGIFKVLANSTRLRMLHVLVREPDMCVSALAGALSMKPQAVSNQLQRLVDRGIVAQRRNGNQIHYRIIDPCIVSLLDRGMCLAEDVSADSGQPAMGQEKEEYARRFHQVTGHQQLPSGLMRHQSGFDSVWMWPHFPMSSFF